MIPYILHVSILMAGSYIFYWLLLRKETFFKLNRGVLMASLLLPIILPLITIPSSLALQIFPSQQSFLDKTTSIIQTTSEDVSTLIQPTENRELDASKNQQATTTEEITPMANPSKLSISQQLFYLYGIGVAVFMLAFLIQLMLILAKVASLNAIQDGKYKIVELVKEEAPYSFWNTIFINPSKYDSETYEQILAHEKIHIDQSHYLDKLLVEMVLIAFWFNPFVWLFRKAITNNLEFLTDESMLNQGFPKQSYQMSLLKVSVPQYPLNLTTNYNQSFLKNRITMMNSKKSSARSIWKYLFILPILGFSILSMNAVEDVPTNNSGKEILEKTNNDPIISKEAIPQGEETPENEALREEVMAQLKKDKLLDGSAPVFKIFPNKILLNDQALSSKLRRIYQNIFKKHGISPDKSKLLIVKPLVILTGTFVGNKDADTNTYIDIFDEADIQVEEKEKVTSTATAKRSNTTSNQISVKTIEGKTYISGKGEHHINGKRYNIKPGEVTVIDKYGNSTIIKDPNLMDKSMLNTDSAPKRKQQKDNKQTIVSTSTHNSTSKQLIITNASGDTYIKDQDAAFSIAQDGTKKPISMEELIEQVSITSPTTSTLSEDFPNKYKHYFKASKGDGSFYFLHSSDLLTASTNEFWTLPDFCKAINKALVEEGVIHSGDKIILYYLGSDGLFINGQYLTGRIVETIESIAEENKIPIAKEFHFELDRNQVICVDQISNINHLRDDLLDQLAQDNLITNKRKKMIMEISGNDISVNGIAVPSNKYRTYFQLFNKHRLIPSPGKTIEISKSNGKDKIQVGYRKDKALLGTFASY